LTIAKLRKNGCLELDADLKNVYYYPELPEQHEEEEQEA